MDEIKGIIFDAGGVVVNPGEQIDRFADIFHTEDKEKLWKLINRELGPLCTGKISERDFWKKIAQSYGADAKDIPDQLWELDYEETNPLNMETLAFVDELRKKYKVILVSNTIEPHVMINRRRGLFDHFDDVLNSNEVGLSKDATEIFELALSRSGLSPSEVAFVDDVEIFLEIVKPIGIRGILFKSAKQIKCDLEALGVSVN